MASYTPNLDLLKKSPVTDGDDMFNVETMLNENWDRIDRGVGDYTTPAQKMGLTGDLSVGASLGVLANIGNVHVWRKTVVTEEEIPAGYKLVDDNTDRTLDGVSNALIDLGNTNQSTARISCADSITVNDAGAVSLNSSTTYYRANDALDAASWLRGKYVNLYYINDFGNWFGPSALDQNKTYYVPNDAQISVNSATIIVDKLQRVDAYPLTPAGTHVTYLTSVNRDAYQEGDDAKEAGYTLGNVDSIILISGGYERTGYYDSAVSVNDDGEVHLANKSMDRDVSIDAASSSVNECNSKLKGQFLDYGGAYILYIPEDAVFSREWDTNNRIYSLVVNKAQRCLGYPAIPAGTTIEYLGVLGEKVSVETGSYTGTGTYGSSNLNTIHLSRPPKLVFITPYNGANRMMLFVLGGNSSFSGYTGAASLSYQQIVSDGTDFSWYANNSDIQLNITGQKYVYTAVI